MSGWLKVIAGPMYSGKTEEMLRLLHREYYADKAVVAFRPAADTRDEENSLLSRSGIYFPAITVKSSFAIADFLINNAPKDVVAIDEAQFFDSELPEIVDGLADMGKTVLVSGLDKDFLGRPFGPMGDLLVMADEVVKLSAICATCKQSASRTQRLIDGGPATADDPLVVIGGKGDDRYEARCREHHEVPL
jgi:thymidine kinase